MRSCRAARKTSSPARGVLAGLSMALPLVLSACVPLGKPAGSVGGSFVQMEEIVIAMLLVAAVVSIVTQRLRIPYTIGLVVVGLAFTLIQKVPLLHITSEVILALLVPPLVFEAAFHLNFRELRHDLGLILVLAIPMATPVEIAARMFARLARPSSGEEICSFPAGVSIVASVPLALVAT